MKALPRESQRFLLAVGVLLLAANFAVAQQAPPTAGGAPAAAGEGGKGAGCKVVQANADQGMGTEVANGGKITVRAHASQPRTFKCENGRWVPVME